MAAGPAWWRDSRSVASRRWRRPALLEQRGAPGQGLILIDTVYPKAVWGGTFYWRLFSGLVRLLRLQELSINGRRLGAMVKDAGLVSQVMAMGGYRVAAMQAPTT